MSQNKSAGSLVPSLRHISKMVFSHSLLDMFGVYRYCPTEVESQALESAEVLDYLLRTHTERMTVELITCLAPDYLPELKLNLCTHLSAENVVGILRKCSMLHRLSLAQCEDLNVSDILNVTQLSLIFLDTLNLNGCSRVTDHDVYVVLKSAQHLQHLSLSETRITDVAFFLDPPLQHQLEMTGKSRCSGKAFSAELVSVDISGCKQFTNDGLLHLCSLSGPTLRFVDVQATKVDFQGLLYMAGHSRLSAAALVRLVHVHSRQATEKGETVSGSVLNRPELPLKCTVPKTEHVSPGADSLAGVADVANSLAGTAADKPGRADDSCGSNDVTKDNAANNLCNLSPCHFPKTEAQSKKESLVECQPGSFVHRLQQDQGHLCDVATFSQISSISHEISSIIQSETVSPSNDGGDFIAKACYASGGYVDDSDRPCFYGVHKTSGYKCKNKDEEIANGLSDSESPIAAVNHGGCAELLRASDLGNSFESSAPDSRPVHTEYTSPMARHGDGLREEFISKTSVAESDSSATKESDIPTITWTVNRQHKSSNNTVLVSGGISELQTSNGQNVQDLNKDGVISNAHLANVNSVKVDKQTGSNNIEAREHLTKAIDGMCQTFLPSQRHMFGPPLMFQPNLITFAFTAKINTPDHSRAHWQLILGCFEAFLRNNSSLQALRIRGSEPDLEETYRRRLQSFSTDIYNQMFLLIGRILPHIHHVSFSQEDVDFHTVSDESVCGFLQTCHQLTALDLEGCFLLSDSAFQRIEQNTALVRLNIPASLITNSTLFLCNLGQKAQLTSLDLSWCETMETDSLNAALACCPYLLVLSLRCCNLTNETLAVLADHCPSIQQLDISGAAGLEDSAVVLLARSLPGLTKLDIGRNTGLGDESVIALLTHCCLLQRLNLSCLQYVTSKPFLSIVQGGREALAAWQPNLNNDLRLLEREKRLLAIQPAADGYGGDQGNSFTQVGRLKHFASLKRSASYGRSLELLELTYCASITEEELQKVVAACRGGLHIIDYYGRMIQPFVGF